MDNVAELIEKLRQLDGKDHAIMEINGHKYHVNKEHAHLVNVPTTESTQLFSLTQAVNFITSMANGSENVPDGSILVNVIDETKVEIVDAAYNENMKRDHFADLCSHDIFDKFSSGKKMSQEEFIIELLTKFVQDEATLEILKLVSDIKTEGETNFKDSGFCQTVNVKAGVVMVNQKQIKNLFLLKTYRTFPEVEQPVIPYILRLHDGGREGKPLFALYAADGGQWKVQATKEIREFFTNQLNAKLGEKSSAVTVL